VKSAAIRRVKVITRIIINRMMWFGFVDCIMLRLIRKEGSANLRESLALPKSSGIAARMKKGSLALNWAVAYGAPSHCCLPGLGVVS